MAENNKRRDAGGLSGAERAAILLMSLGETDAAAILKHMGPKEVQKVGTAMAHTSNVSKEVVLDVINSFVEEVDAKAALGGSEDYIKNLLMQALGEDKASQVIDRILLGHSSKGLESLKWMEPKAVAELIRTEHPQIIAIVLSYLDGDQAAAILSILPERTRSDIVMRIASLDGIQPSALQELDLILEKQFTGNSSVQSSSVGGMKTAANILNFMDGSVESEIMDEVKEADAELGQGIEELMFVFDNLVDIDDRGIQTLLREVSSETLVLALKAADETVKEKIFKNMSKRASEMLRDDLEARGPVKLSDVEAAQKEVLAIARRMMESGELAMGGKGGDEYV
ncbi:flagellar motor switch protein FliG [Candidatus Tenderia electrophaga]|jgi:flagellar motor switch protein FliG|uniref:Flagellar motor switch protein FliG n=1 Tax=Candidatus Tenderia electrophaga TaxID=1748243 RepID=A0A0S2TC39_9GAMM|nr:flagellar motor switch protein FliG [Candidatus Tenderia electrophaga]